MYTNQVLVLERKDMLEEDSEESISSIVLSDFKLSRISLMTSDLIMFVDDNSNIKLLKSRWGKEGLII